MSEWKEYKLGEICDVRDGTHDSPKANPSGYPLVTSKNIKDGKIDLFNTYFISEADYKFVNQRSKVEQWDIIYSMIGTIGECAIVKDVPTFAIKNVGLFKTNGNQLLAQWIYYYLHSSVAQKELTGRIKGSTQQYISLTDLREFPIMIPPIDEQKRIAGVLSSLDDKIDLLNRENATLEALAETLFRHYFIENPNPEWKEAKLGDVAKIGIGRTPPRKETKWFSTSSIDVKWISIKDMGETGVYIFNTAEYLTREAVDCFKIPIIPNNTVVLSFKMTVGRIGITSEAMLSNEAIAHFILYDNSPVSKEYLYIFLKLFKFETLGSTSSIVTSINSAMIKEMELIIPDKDTMMSFDKQVCPLFEKIKSNQQQILTLTAQRNTLLSRIMSGELKVA